MQVWSRAAERCDPGAFSDRFVREITRSCDRLARSPRARLPPSDLSLPAVSRGGFAT
jgi:hypothetical protein